MKNFRDYLEEAEKSKTQTKDKTADTDWSGLDDLFKPKADQPLAKKNQNPTIENQKLIPTRTGGKRLLRQIHREPLLVSLPQIACEIY